MYKLTLANGRIIKFTIKDVAELYRVLYGGHLEYQEELTYAWSTSTHTRTSNMRTMQTTTTLRTHSCRLHTMPLPAMLG